MKKYVLIGMLAFAMSAASASAGVVAYYSFDTDYSDGAGTNHLTEVEVGGATAGVSIAAAVFGARGLDIASTTGNEAYLDLASPITFGGSDAWSVSFWARRGSNSDNRQGMVLGDTSNTTDFIWLSNNPSQVRGVRFRNSNNVTSDYGVYEPDGDDFEYHHYAVIADGAGNVTVYYDGANAGTLSASGAFSITSVGAAYSATTHTLNGQMDELYIFDEAIDAATVNSLYTSNIPEPATLTLLALGGMGLLRRRKG